MDTYGHLFPNGDDGQQLAAAEVALLSLDATQTRHEVKYFNSLTG